MAEARRTDLSYGHLGEPFYDVDDKEWKFARRPGIGLRLSPVSESRLVLQPSTDPHVDIRQQTARARYQNIAELTRLYPELVPAASLLAPFTRVSEAVVEATAGHDPLVSDLMAFGTASRLERNRPSVRTVPLVVVAGGVAGEGVRFLQPKRKILRWPEHRSVGLSLFTLESAEEAWWPGNGSPVQQLCFSSIDNDSGGWLAARYHGATTILRPLFHQTLVPSSRPSQDHHSKTVYAPSHINPNPIVTLDIQATGGAPHVNVSFNPWYERQVAIMDIKGYWSIWDIEGRHGRTWSAKPDYDGHLSDDLAEGAEGLTSHSPDGWGIALFVSNVHTLLIAGRTVLSIIDIGSNKQRLKVPDLGLNKSAEWILDIKRSPTNSNQVFAVTSSRVFWIEVRFQSDIGNSNQAEVGAVVLLSCLHFRNQGDIGLRMQVVCHNETHLATLYSRSNNLCTVFSFQKDDSTSTPLSVSDPYQLPLDLATEFSSQSGKDTDHTQSKPHVLTLVLSGLNYDLSSKSQPSGRGKTLYLTKDIRFYQLSYLYNDLSVREIINAQTSSSELYKVSAPTLKSFARSVKARPKYVNDDFVVSDGFLEDELQHIGFRHRSIPHPRNFRRRTKASEGQSDPWTLDFSWLQRSLQRARTPTVASCSKLDDAPPGLSLEAALEKLTGPKIQGRLTLEKASNDTLLESLGNIFFPEDIDIVSASTKDWLESTSFLQRKIEGSNVDDSSTIRSAPIMTNTLSESILGVHAMKENQQLLDVYQGLMESWISPLSSEVPNQVRVQMEKTIRHIATQLFLAKFTMRPRPYPLPKEHKETTEDSLTDFSKQLNLPVRAKEATSRSSSQTQLIHLSPSSQSSSQLSKNAEVTTLQHSPRRPSPPHFPTSPPSTPYPTASTVEAFDPASLRLGALTTLTPQPLLPPPLSKVLTHWTIGQDPIIYDWDAMQVALGGLSDTEGTESDVTFKQSSRREKRRKRLRGDTVESLSQPITERMGSQAEAVASQVTEGLGLSSRVGEEGSRVSVGGKEKKEGKRKRVKRAAGF